jgi:hypothetical protein
VDILEQRVNELESGGWDEEFTPAREPRPIEDPGHVPARSTPGPLPHQGQPEDGIADDNPDVVQARRRKAAADGWLKKPVAPTPEVQFQVLNVDGVHTIKVHQPTEEQVGRRKEFIRLGMLDNIKSLPVPDAKEAYMKGGPLWLHAFDREFVVGLPAEARAWMAQDVYQTDPTAAGNLARDILKFDDLGSD